MRRVPRPDPLADARADRHLDLLLTGGTVLGHGEVAIGVAGGTIAAIGSAADLRRGAAARPREVSVAGTLVAPGCIDAHHHLTGDPLAQGCIPDQISSDEAIHGWAVPLHAHHDAIDDEVSAALEAVRCLRQGTTTVLEAGTVGHVDAVARALDTVGLRGIVGRWGSDTEGLPYAGPVDEVIEAAAGLVDRHPAGGRVSAGVTLVGHDLMSDDLVVAASDLARRREVGLTFHLSPTAADPAAYEARTGRRPVAHLAELGVLGPHLVLAHGVWLDDDEIDLLVAHDVAIAVCPWAYLRLAQGIVGAGRHRTFLERGGRLAIGTDAANAGDHRSVLSSAALLVGLWRDHAVDAAAPGAATGFDLATSAGAAAIGRPELGRLEVGAPADLVCVEIDGPDWSPAGDPITQLVWGAPERRVRHVVVDGEVVLRDGAATRVDQAALVADAAERQRFLLARAGR